MVQSQTLWSFGIRITGIKEIKHKALYLRVLFLLQIAHIVNINTITDYTLIPPYICKKVLKYYFRMVLICVMECDSLATPPAIVYYFYV